MRLRGELRDELELLRGEEDRRVADVNATSRPVDHEVPGHDDRAGGRRAPTQEGANPREQFLVRIGASDHVVGASVEGAHALDGIRRRR